MVPGGLGGSAREGGGAERKGVGLGKSVVSGARRVTNRDDCAFAGRWWVFSVEEPSQSKLAVTDGQLAKVREENARAPSWLLVWNSRGGARLRESE